MKKTLLSLPLFFLCCWFYGYGQTPDWVWARSAQSSGTNGVQEGCSIAIDNAENVYLTGAYAGTSTFGPYTLTTNPGGVFLAKYDANGNIIWVKSNSTSNASDAQGISVSIDGANNIYVAGLFDYTISFGGYTLVSSGGYDAFVVKYDSSGNVLWAKSGGGNYDDEGWGICCDHSGNIYLTGHFDSPSATFGSYTLNTVGTQDIFLVKFDSSGTVLWAKEAGGAGADQGIYVTTDVQNNVYLTGFYGYPNAAFGTNILSNSGTYDVFLAKYDSLGNVLWVRRAGGGNDDEGTSVVADSWGNVYLTGFYNSPIIYFGSHSFNSAGDYNGFFVKYDSSGNVIWAKNFGGSYDDYGWNVTLNNHGKVFLTGGFSLDTITLDTIVLLPTAGSYDPMFIACYDTSGNILWAKKLLSGGDDEDGIAIASSGCIYIGGDFWIVNPFIIGNDSLILTGVENAFVAKLCNTLLVASFTSSSAIFCAEPTHCINFFDQSLGNPTSWHWLFTGGAPDTSSLQNPDSICYSAAGTYPVQLIVSNGTTTDTLTVASMIIVGGTPVQPTISIVGGDTLYSSHGSAYQWYLNGSIIAGATDSFYIEHHGGTYSVQVTDQYGCYSSSAGIQVDINELSGGVGVAVYPNPFTNELTVTPLPLKGVMAANSPLGGGGEFILFDVTSRVLLHRLFTNQTTINTEQLAGGMYFYEVKDKNGVREMGKVVKE